MEVWGEKLGERRFGPGVGTFFLGIGQDTLRRRRADAGAGYRFDGLNPGVELLL